MAKKNKRLVVTGGNENNATENATENATASVAASRTMNSIVNRTVKRVESKTVRNGVWKAETNHGVEYGCLEYVLAEVSRTGLCYHFCLAGERDHEHTFTGVLRALVAEPGSFSVEGFEREYSEQELHFLKRVQEELTDGGKTVIYVSVD